MVKYRRLDHDIFNSLASISSLEILYLVKEKLGIFKQVKINMFKI